MKMKKTSHHKLILCLQCFILKIVFVLFKTELPKKKLNLMS